MIVVNGGGSGKGCICAAVAKGASRTLENVNGEIKINAKAWSRILANNPYLRGGKFHVGGTKKSPFSRVASASTAGQP
jgi:hypothetical protein